MLSRFGTFPTRVYAIGTRCFAQCAGSKEGSASDKPDSAYTYLPPGCSVSDPLYKISTTEPVYFYDKPSQPPTSGADRSSASPRPPAGNSNSPTRATKAGSTSKVQKVSPLNNFVEFTTKLRETDKGVKSTSKSSLPSFVAFTARLREAAASPNGQSPPKKYVFVPAGTSLKDPKYFSMGDPIYSADNKAKA